MQKFTRRLAKSQKLFCRNKIEFRGFKIDSQSLKNINRNINDENKLPLQLFCWSNHESKKFFFIKIKCICEHFFMSIWFMLCVYKQRILFGYLYEP